MKVIETATLRPGFLSHHDALQVYNGLDCALTVEILEEVSGPNSKNISAAAQTVYDFSRAMQAPALEMMLRGWRVDVFQRDIEVARMKRERVQLQKILDEFVLVLWDGGTSPLSKSKRKADHIPGLNPASPKQMKEFFYTILKIPEQFNYAKGQRTVTTNREALENCENYYHARIFVNLILAIRERNKKISVLTSEIDPDLRMRTSYNVTGTETGRWSASKNVYDGGTNLQNITEELRQIFISDPGKKLAYIDKSQAESRVLGWLLFILFGDSSYLDACESGDLHTIVCKLIWPELKWTGDSVEDKAVAEQKFYLHYSYRDMAKRGGHGTNYYGTPRTMAKHLKIREELMAKFQEGYFKAFPGIRRYHQWVATQIQTKQYLETPLGMGRHFFGRPGDDTTLREAIAFIPQSVVGQLLNLALWRNWRHMPKVDRLGQIHDAIVIQYPEEDEQKIIPRAVELMPTPLYHEGRKFTIPSDVMVGWNWAKQKKNKKTGVITNPDGLISWAGHDNRTRKLDPSASGLDRLIT